MARPSLFLGMTFRIAPDNPVVRFRISLENHGAETMAFVQTGGPLTYLSTSFTNMSRVKQVRLSDSNSMLHSDKSASSTFQNGGSRASLTWPGPS